MAGGPGPGCARRGNWHGAARGREQPAGGELQFASFQGASAVPRKQRAGPRRAPLSRKGLGLGLQPPRGGGARVTQELLGIWPTNQPSDFGSDVVGWLRWSRGLAGGTRGGPAPARGLETRPRSPGRPGARALLLQRPAPSGVEGRRGVVKFARAGLTFFCPKNPRNAFCGLPTESAPGRNPATRWLGRAPLTSTALHNLCRRRGEQSKDLSLEISPSAAALPGEGAGKLMGRRAGPRFLKTGFVRETKLSIRKVSHGFGGRWKMETENGSLENGCVLLRRSWG